MLRIAILAPFHAVFLGVTVLVAPATGQDPVGPGTVAEVPLPGGLRAAQAAIGDLANPDRAQFLSEFIRRTYDTPLGAKGDRRDPVLQSLVSQLKTGGEPTDTLPLPLSTKIWTDVVFRGKATPQTLVSLILQSRSAALFYNALLALDDDSRAWIAGQASLIADILSRRSAAFVVAAPGFRVASDRVRVPGGPLAEPVWQALVGHAPTDPEEFLRSLLGSNEGRLAHFFGAIGQLTPSQIRVALDLGASDVGKRVDAGRRLYSVFERLWAGRAVEQRVFSRPAFDPALLISELGAPGQSELSLPGTRGLWSAVFSEPGEGLAKNGHGESPAAIVWDQPPDFAWLCEQVFKDATEQRRRFMMVLFASRHSAGITRETSSDALEAIRAVRTYPALTAALERAKVTDIAVFASAARRANALSATEDERRVSRALAQYQGALAMIVRGATRGSLTPEAATKLVSSLSAIETDDRGDYDGRVVAWLGTWLNTDARSAERASSNGPAVEGSAEELYESAAGPMEEYALRVLAGPESPAPRLIDWEGTRYRIDLPLAEVVRLTKSQGQSSRPYLSAAWAVTAIAKALAEPGLTRESLLQQAEAFSHVWQPDATDGGEEAGTDIVSTSRDVAASLQKASRAGDLRAASRLAPTLRQLADDLVARGLMEWAYAAALGPRDGMSISAADAASRHDFGLHTGLGGRAGAWRLPQPGRDVTQRWRVGGSLLALDVALADFSLVSLSSKPPRRTPMLSEIDRHVFIDAVALIEPKSLSDTDRDAIAAAIRKGRTRLDAVRASDDVRTVADAIGLSAQRRTLLAWTVVHDPKRTTAFLSPTELYWLGVDGVPPAVLDAWGAPAGSRLGCLCLQVINRRPWEIFAGRWNTGMTASAFPDLNFRLAELLSELHMPAALLAPVLTSATLDFVNSVTSRDPDDRRGLVEFVQALDSDRVEQYLALLTTDGPLVPLGDSPGRDPDHLVMMERPWWR